MPPSRKISEPTVTTVSRSAVRGRRDAEVGAALVVLLECDRPLAGSSRHRLVGIDEVVIGRSATRQVERDGARLTLRFADARISTTHASITRADGAFVLADRQSKNGVIVNGRRVDGQRLRDGDVIECGRTFFLFLESCTCSSGEPLDLHARELPSAMGVPTFHGPLAVQLRALEEVARTDIPVLVFGASGTGKELLSRAVHARSARAGAFVPVNCGALPENLVESELFGARKGAFTGAEDKPGLVRASDGGTLFLDEIGDLPLRAQPALLRVLQEREVLAVGATRPAKVDLRVVAATHRDLEAEVRAGRFRADLLARLSGFIVRLPPLRKRLEDFGLLVAALLARHGGRDVTVSNGAMRALLGHPWPLNVRQLEHCLRAALALSPDRIDEVELPPAAVEPAPVVAAKKLTPEQQKRREELCALLVAHDGNIAAVARQMGKDRVQIRRWLRMFGISPDELLRR